MSNLANVHTSLDNYLNVNGLKIHYRTQGSGRPLLLLHGWGGSIDSMQTILAEFVNGRAVYVFDLPGHGKSELPPCAWNTMEFTNSVLMAMDLLGLKDPDIIGHSFGGKVGIQIAALHPDRVRKLVLVNSAGVLPPRPLKYKFKVAIAKVSKFLGNYGGPIGQSLRDSVYKRVASRDYLSAGPMRQSLVRIVRESLTGLMPQINAPTLLVWGENDEDTPVSSAATMHELIKGSQLVILQHAGHFSYIDQPNQFGLLVKKFLRE